VLPVRTVRGHAVPLYRPDIDTDQIMPKQFLMSTSQTGYGAHVFQDWRRDPTFVLNDPRFRDARIMVAGRNFGSGSSREHAVWGLQQYGIDAVLAPSFSDIFVGNCVQNGLLTGSVSEQAAQTLVEHAFADPQAIFEVDLVAQCVRSPCGDLRFDISPAHREALLTGRDDITTILERASKIDAYERSRPDWSSNTVSHLRPSSSPRC
jgi:3-isopropylmalate/(R)-2-methylmalate dehydratase small subunit